MKLSAWGRYPIIESDAFFCANYEELSERIKNANETIAFGNGRSYGDSALNSNIVKMRQMDRFLAFDAQSGVLICEAGVLLSEIIEAFLPQGFFLAVTPGTKLITIGGAIASDVHGKNHHIGGCFSECVEWLDLMIADGSILRCSPQENNEIFLATCGGMGLTGIILRAAIKLKRIPSHRIAQTLIKTRNLEESFNAFERAAKSTYSVAWIDCLQSEESLGRSVLMAGDFAENDDKKYAPKNAVSVPFEFPSFALNKWSVKAFNALYYAKAKAKQNIVGIDSFFYPLDAIGNWNRIYGKSGFTQYQFILPKAQSYDGLQAILKAIAKSGKGSFLAVLKLYGKENENYLSFPIEGYSLALDFKIENDLFELLVRLDRLVVEFGGRIYLTKDSRLSKDIFYRGYPKIDRFLEVKSRVDPNHKFASLQSKRVGL